MVGIALLAFVARKRNQIVPLYVHFAAVNLDIDCFNTVLAIALVTWTFLALLFRRGFCLNLHFVSGIAQAVVVPLFSKILRRLI